MHRFWWNYIYGCDFLQDKGTFSFAIQIIVFHGHIPFLLWFWNCVLIDLSLIICLQAIKDIFFENNRIVTEIQQMYTHCHLSNKRWQSFFYVFFSFLFKNLIVDFVWIQKAYSLFHIQQVIIVRFINYFTIH